jgi:hypothetical protein
MRARVRERTTDGEVGTDQREGREGGCEDAGVQERNEGGEVGCGKRACSAEDVESHWKEGRVEREPDVEVVVLVEGGEVCGWERADPAVLESWFS